MKTIKRPAELAHDPRPSRPRSDRAWQTTAACAIGAGILWAFLGPMVAVMLSFIAFITMVLFRKFHSRSALMELADGISGVTPPEIAVRAERMAKLKASATPPPTQEQELGKLDVDPPPRFVVDDPKMLTFLEEHGYAVVNLGISRSKIERFRLLLWDFLEKHTHGWKCGEPDTWDDNGLNRIGSTFNGIVNGSGMGNSDFLWAVRTEVAVQEVFRRIWGEVDLLTSFDGGNVFRPWHPADKATASRRTFGGWWHVDQGSAKAGKRHAVQGLVSLFDADESTGGLCVMPGSHTRHAEVCADQTGTSKRDYVTVQPYLPGFSTMHRKLICCRAGDMVLWDSRTIHCNTPAPKPKLERLETKELLRAVAYVCMTPKRFASAEVRRLRRCGFEARVSTSHWPHEYHPGHPGLDEEPLDYASASKEIQDLVD